HPHNIAQKSAIIVDHYRQSTQHKIGGRAKAMLVTRSRLHAVRYKHAIDAYIKHNNFTDMKTLVAFSGTVDDSGETYTETEMNYQISFQQMNIKYLLSLKNTKQVLMNLYFIQCMSINH